MVAEMKQARVDCAMIVLVVAQLNATYLYLCLHTNLLILMLEFFSFFFFLLSAIECVCVGGDLLARSFSLTNLVFDFRSSNATDI